MLGATWVLWLLVLLSVVGFAVILERAYFFVMSREDWPRFRADLAKAFESKDWKAARERANASKSPEARIIAAGLEAPETGAASVEERMASETQAVKLGLERNLAFLGTVGNNAPFVGLLGTVIGVLRAFHSLDKSGGQISSGLMAEVGEALVATAIGILVALPAVAFFNFFQRAIRVRVSRAESLGRLLLASLKSE